MEQTSKLKEKYDKEVAPELAKEFGIKSNMAIPKITKIVINMGVGDMIKDKSLKDTVASQLATITGQAPSVRAAKISVAAFGLRAGMPVGLTVTLRGAKMYAFLERLIAIVLPRLRDFRGVSRKSFDKLGNYTLGVREHTVFPEIDLTKGVTPRGLEISVVVSGKERKISERLLELLGMPFEKMAKE